MSYRIPLSRPSIGDLEQGYVAAALFSGQVALGPQLARFEQLMAARCSTKHAVAVSSGTAALHLIVRALGLGDHDAVITTPYSFVASANCLLYERCVPVFVDIDPATFNIDPQRVESAITPATRAILAVDVFGCPADWPALTGIADRHGLLLIDDGCEALGASIDGRPIGAWGHACAFGFYPNKQITTGEGGCVTTNDDRIAALARSLRNQGRASDARMEHTRLGYNYRLDEMSAALGRAQLERFHELEGARRRAADWYEDGLAGLTDDLTLPARPQAANRSWFVYVVRLADHFQPGARDGLIRGLAERGIQAAPYFPTIHLQPLYRNRFGFKEGAYPIAEHLAERTVALPFFAGISQSEVDEVCTAVKECLVRLPGKKNLPAG